MCGLNCLLLGVLTCLVLGGLTCICYHWREHLLCDKTMHVSRQNYVCRNKTFLEANICPVVATKPLSLQADCCPDKVSILLSQQFFFILQNSYLWQLPRMSVYLG